MNVPSRMPSIYRTLLTAGILLAGSITAKSAFDHGHTSWDGILKEHVSGSSFDYAALSVNVGKLDSYLEELNAVSREEVDVWPRDKRLAYWINAYNAFTVKAILDHYPIRSRTLKGLFVPANSIIQIPGVWKKLKWRVAGQALTLDYIEHGLLRPEFKEPRIHFAIVCASVGCPDLRPEAFTHEKLERQLEEQTRAFLLDESKGVKLDFDKKRVCVSKLFKWFTEDFAIDPPKGLGLEVRAKRDRVILGYIAHYLRSGEAWELFRSRNVKVDTLKYDWSLNDI